MHPVPVEAHDEDTEIQSAIVISVCSSSLSTDKVVIGLSGDAPRRDSRGRRRRSFLGESSKSAAAPVLCKICMEEITKEASFTVQSCCHTFCVDCISKHVASRIQENSKHIRCPEDGCKTVMEPEFCQSILPSGVFERWSDVLCESLILDSMRFYCPFKDCSALLLDDSGDKSQLKESECPHCHRLFCVQCRIPWHAGFSCEEIQTSRNDESPEDLMLTKLAKDQKWQRCPACRFYVERTQGCLFMRCRCGHCFCYNCGAPLVDHYCSKCKR